MHEVLDAVRREREDRRGDERRIGAAGQMAREDVHADPRRDDAAEQQHVVDDHGVRARPEERKGEQPLEQCRVGVGERARVRIEDVAVEQMPDVGRQRVRDPLEAPHAEKRVPVRGHPAAHVQALRPRHHDRQHGQQGAG